MQARNWAARADLLARTADELERLGLVAIPKRPLTHVEERRLRREQARGNVNNVTSAEHAMATSRGRARDPLVRAANAAGFTLRSLAAAVGVSVSLLSMARRQRDGRSIRRAVAERIAELTGFAASPANWPGGIV